MFLVQPRQFVVHHLVAVCSVHEHEGYLEEAVLEPGAHSFQTPIPHSDRVAAL